MQGWDDGEYREWKPGCWEKLLPRAWDDFNADNRLKRVNRLCAHIKEGADRAICRGLVYTEEEWAAGCRMAGREPGDGWLERPYEQPVHVAQTAPKPKDLAPVAETLDKWWDKD